MNKREMRKLFIDLYELGLKQENKSILTMRTCTKLQKDIHFRGITKMKCWNCKEYLLNKGVCDPV